MSFLVIIRNFFFDYFFKWVVYIFYLGKKSVISDRCKTFFIIKSWGLFWVSFKNFLARNSIFWVGQVIDSFKWAWKFFSFEKLFFGISIRHFLFRNFLFGGRPGECTRWIHFPLQVSCVKKLGGSTLPPWSLAFWQKRKRTWCIAQIWMSTDACPAEKDPEPYK